MNEREIAELRRQFSVQRSNITKIRGCFVNERNEIINEFTQPLLAMTDEETEEILKILKKTLSGGLGRNLNDLPFTNQQVLDSDEHRLLMKLRDSALDDADALHELYAKMVPNLSIDGSYLILLAHEQHDIFAFARDGQKEEDSTKVFTFFVCCVCPIKQSRASLAFHGQQQNDQVNAFRNIAANSVVGVPELGFIFPAFDDRTANIYDALFYAKDGKADYSAFVGEVFHSELPMPAGTQKETFAGVLAETVGEACDLDVVCEVKEQITEMITEHKASREKEPLLLSKEDISGVLRSCDVEEEKIEAFAKGYDEAFGVGVTLPPTNIVETKQLQLCTPDVVIKVNPAREDLVSTRIIDGVKYIMIRADEGVDLNGIPIAIGSEDLDRKKGTEND